MKTVQYSIIIKKPVYEVFQYIENPAHKPEWEEPVLEAKITEGNTVKEGATIEVKSQVLGRKFTARGKVITYEENKKTSCISSKPFNHVITNTYEAVDGGTLFTRTGEADIDAVKKKFKFASPMVVKIMESSLKQSAKKAKEILES
ncbi:SRPBCC family protein [Alteribacter populi]|uniref:SRPBCC family protein n=1 Tax=Alteribacter populi TaxID=2011011 RepID=UPI000BBB2F6E|nr:SRPBCC family protein [Alteribacter populi]